MGILKKILQTIVLTSLISVTACAPALQLFNLEPPKRTSDTNGDGRVDQWNYDMNGDGRIDYRKLDPDFDGTADIFLYDNNYDGNFEEIVYKDSLRADELKQLIICIDGVAFKVVHDLWHEGYFNEFYEKLCKQQ